MAEVTATAALDDLPDRTCESRVPADDGVAEDEGPESNDSIVPA
jgi:hypothetical protein